MKKWQAKSPKYSKTDDVFCGSKIWALDLNMVILQTLHFFNSSHKSLFVFQRDDPQQNGVKLLTPVTVLIRFSMLFQMVPFILLCMVAHLTITWLVETIPTANQRALCWWFLKLPWREKRKVPSERAMKIESETGVKSDTPFCLRLPIEKTNSVLIKWEST